MFKWFFRKIYASELSAIKGVVEAAGKIVPIQQFITAQSFDPKDQQFMGFCSKLAADPCWRFLLVLNREKFWDNMKEHSKNPGVANNPNLLNQIFGRICCIEELGDYVKTKAFEYQESLKEYAEEVPSGKTGS